MAGYSPVQRARRKKVFLGAFRRDGIISSGAKAADVTRDTVYDWIKKDADFAREFRAAEDEAADRFEAEVVRRAVEGLDKPHFLVVSQGRDEPAQVEVHTERVYSDFLLRELMRARKGTYRQGDRSQVDLNVKDERTPDQVREDLDRKLESMAQRARPRADGG